MRDATAPTFDLQAAFDAQMIGVFGALVALLLGGTGGLFAIIRCLQPA